MKPNFSSLAFNLEKILDVNAHVLKPGTFILVDHKG
ncbi:capping complex subunit for YIEGIA [Paenibacillus sp. 1P03SA]